MIVDSQVHMAAPGNGNWSAQPAVRANRNSVPEEDTLLAEMDRAGVDAVVLVPSLGPNSEPDNATCLAAARRFPSRFGVMGRLSEKDDSQASLLESWLDQPGMLGVRLSFHVRRGNDQALRDGSIEWLWQRAEERSIPVMVYAPGLAAELFVIAEAHPELRMLVDHLGLPIDETHDDLRPSVQPLLALAQLPNVAVKASCLPAVVSESYPFPAIRDCMKEVVDAFGASRVCWGSDLSRLPCDYGEMVSFFTDELPFLSEYERDEILGGALLRWLRWEPH